MKDEATREILWNVNSVSTPIIMYSLMALSLIVFFIGIFRRIEIWLSAKPSPENTGRWIARSYDLFMWAFLHRGVLKKTKVGIAHLVIFLGFLVLLFTTSMVFLHHDLKWEIYKGRFYLTLTILSDLFGLALLIGCAVMGYRRYIRRSDEVHSRPADSFMLASLALLIVQGFLLEGLRIQVTGDPWQYYSPVGLAVSKFFWFLSSQSASRLHFITWWFHTVTVFVVLALLPYSKFLHLLTSPLNLFFKRTDRPKGALQFLGDIQDLMETSEDLNLGLGTIKDYSWKQLLDLDACTSCGRCQEACPAYISGKPLSPKWIILDTRNHLLALNAKNRLESPSKFPEMALKIDRFLTSEALLKSSGLVTDSSDDNFRSSGTYRSKNELVQNSAISAGVSTNSRIAGEVIDSEAFWSCNTCMACVQACPVGINHVDQIIGNRRNMAMIQGEIPTEAQATLRALENRGNPYGPAEDRVKWIEGLDVRILQPGDSVDYLYWVGCVSSFDPRKQKIARALVKIMKSAGLSFGILGSSEGCSGDPARRLGEENLFQTLAKANIETLLSIKFSTLVANCPHCFNTIKNEYPQLGNLGEGRQPKIVHHSQLLKGLLKENKIQLINQDIEITLHDPCYLSRYNDETDAPRDSLTAIKGLKIIEMEKSGKESLCCGAGGGHFWMDLKIGQRVNVIRVDQAADTGASEVATACPFCLQMMEDGVKLTEREDKLAVRDIAEIVADNLK